MDFLKTYQSCSYKVGQGDLPRYIATPAFG